MNWNNNQPLRELVIYSKKHWLKKKEEYKNLKNELQIENKDLFISCFKQTNDDINIIKEGTLVIIKNLSERITKNEIKIWVSHFVEPAYVDFNNSKKECIVRFSHSIFADSFINLFKNMKDTRINNHNNIVKLEKLQGEDETKYINKVRKLQEDFAKNKTAKKNQTSSEIRKNNLEDNHNEEE